MWQRSKKTKSLSFTVQKMVHSSSTSRWCAKHTDTPSGALGKLKQEGLVLSFAYDMLLKGLDVETVELL